MPSKVAVNGRSSRSAVTTCACSPNFGRKYSRAERAMFCETSSATTRPFGRACSRSAVRRPVPAPASRTNSSPRSFRRARTFFPQLTCGCERRWYSEEFHSRVGFGDGLIAASSDRGQGLVKIVHDVFHVFDSNRNANQAVGNADLFSSFFSQRGVSHGGGVRDQGFNSSQRLGQGAQTNFLQHFFGVGQRSGLEGNHRAKAGHLTMSQVVLSVLRETGIENPSYFFVMRQEFSNDTAATIVLFHADRKRLDAAQYQPAFERRKNGSGGFLCKSQFVSLLLGGANHDPAEPVAVSVEEFRGGVHNHVGSEPDRLLKVGRHESVVHDQLHFLAAAYLADGPNIGKRHQGVGGGFNIDHAGIFSDGAFYVSRVRSVDIGEFHSEICQDLIEKTGHASVQVVAANNMIAGLVHGADGVDRGHAAGENTRGDPAFEHCQVFFQASTGGIGNAGVLVSFILAEFLLDVGGSRVDGCRNRPGFRVGILAGVNGLGGETWLFVLGHCVRFQLSAFSFRPSVLSSQFSALRFWFSVLVFGFSLQFFDLSV